MLRHRLVTHITAKSQREQGFPHEIMELPASRPQSTTGHAALANSYSLSFVRWTSAFAPAWTRFARVDRSSASHGPILTCERVRTPASPFRLTLTTSAGQSLTADPCPALRSSTPWAPPRCGFSDRPAHHIPPKMIASARPELSPRSARTTKTDRRSANDTRCNIGISSATERAYVIPCGSPT